MTPADLGSLVRRPGRIQKSCLQSASKDACKEDKASTSITAPVSFISQRTPIDLPISQQVIKAVQSATNKQLILEPTSGGSLPLYLFEKHLNAKVINLCLVNHDNNQHSENENVRLQNLWDSIAQLAAIMIMD